MRIPTPKNVAVLGSTGSIGTASLQVLESLGTPFRIAALSAHRNADLFRQQTQHFQPDLAVLTDLPTAQQANWSGQLGPSSLAQGADPLLAIAANPDIDILIAAIVGSAGLESCLVAAEHGKRIGLANKEALVVAGSLLIDAVQRGKSELLPIDSEHSAIFQALQACQGGNQVRRLILTASGGPLRQWPLDKLPLATPADALAHPTWQMGRKISIDSATMMNKALEIIEAHWLFGIDADRIQVIVHPQSYIHSMVEFVDGSVIAQLSPPDMRLPIQYALTYPTRLDSPATPMDWQRPMTLDWTPIDLDRYPALLLGYEVIKRGGSCGAVLNASNEAAVQLFLNGEMRFTDIAKSCRQVLENHSFDPSPSLSQLLELDRWARREVHYWAKVSC